MIDWSASPFDPGDRFLVCVLTRRYSDWLPAIDEWLHLGVEVSVHSDVLHWLRACRAADAHDWLLLACYDKSAEKALWDWPADQETQPCGGASWPIASIGPGHLTGDTIQGYRDRCERLRASGWRALTATHMCDPAPVAVVAWADGWWMGRETPTTAEEE